MTNMPPSKEFTQKCKDAEFFETPVWVAEAILDVEIMTTNVIDPCAGRGVLGTAAYKKGYDKVLELDLNKWPGQPASVIPNINWLKNQMMMDNILENWKEPTVFMNPPFSKACEFVNRSFEMGARKILMFQRLSFLESATRRGFFEDQPPARIWLCGDRAACFRGDMPEEDMIGEDGKLIKGKKGRSSPTAHAWFVWERGHRGTMNIHHLYKEK